MDWVRRFAIVLRIEEAGVSSYEAVGVPLGVVWEDEEAAGLYFSMSDFVTRPPGPVPLIWERGTPFSRASFLAKGLAEGSRSRLV